MKFSKYFKAKPTEYVLHFRRNKLIRSGEGISFFYCSPSTNIVKIPINSRDLPFIFNEITLDYQPITVQGQLSFRVVDPKSLSKMLDFSLNENAAYSSEDPKLLLDRLVNLTQVSAKEAISNLILREALVSGKEIVSSMLTILKESNTIKSLGIEILGINIISIKTFPEMTKALESNTREKLLQEADLAIYERRNTAVEQERRIKENELKTEIKIEEEKRKVREAKMLADIAIEKKRSELMVQKIENDKKKADSQAYAAEVMMKAVQDVEWQKLLAVFSRDNLDSSLMIATAFENIAKNASKIGSLNISPDLLKALTDSQKSK